MNWNTFFLTTYEVLLAIIFSLITVFITKVVLNRTLLKKDLDGDHNNIAVSLISGTTILCILMLVNSSVLPAVDTLNVMVATGEKLTAGMFLTSFLYFLLFYSISMFFSILLLFTALKVYLMSTTKVDEEEELQKNNIAVSVLMSMVLIGITLSVQPSLERFIFSMVNYDTSEQIAQPIDDEEGMVIPEVIETD